MQRVLAEKCTGGVRGRGLAEGCGIRGQVRGRSRSEDKEDKVQTDNIFEPYLGVRE